MASIIDEFKAYLNTPKKIILFRFGICFVFFLLGLSMVTRVCQSSFSLMRTKISHLFDELGRLVCS